ncbi:MAG TPA: thioredoxin family protein [Patescibacteria group bacterium]|nr:thioredoxin family protein [Patescibacteria group bacterium]
MFKILTVAALALFAFQGPAFAAAEIGKPAPGFTLPAADGGTASLADYAGKIVVLEWHNKGCPFVKKHYESGNMQALQKEYTGKDVVWLTINSSAPDKQGHEAPADALATAKNAGAAPTEILIDEKGEVGRLYGATTTPTMAVIDKSGTLVYEGAIDDKASPDQEDIKGATNYVHDAVEAVMAGKPVAVATTKSYGCGIKYAD